MAQKIKLGAAPKTFVAPVEIVLLGGATTTIDFTFKYRTRSQYAELLDQKAKDDELAFKQAKEAAEAAQKENPDAVFSKPVTEWYRETDEANAALVLKIAESWDLDEPFTEKSLLQLEDEYPGSLVSAIVTYRKSVAEARAKN